MRQTVDPTPADRIDGCVSILRSDGHSDDICVVAVTRGDERETLPDLRWALHDSVRAGARTIVVDLTGSGRVGSGTIAAMLGAHRVCKARGGGVVVRNPARHTDDLLQRTGLWRVFSGENRSGAGRRGPR